LDKQHRPAARPAIEGSTVADLVVIGGGFAGLWTALLAKERDPSREVVLLEADRIGWAASGRNGGFCSASLTHGRGNGMRHFPDEYQQLHKLGLQNLDDIEATIDRYGIKCGFERNGTLSVATEPWQLPDEGEVLSAEQVRAHIDSPRFVGGIWERGESALLDPAELAWGLADAVASLGVRVHEDSKAVRLVKSGRGVVIETAVARVEARRAVLATNVFPSLVRRMRLHTVPVYDYAIVSEALSDAQLAAIGWSHRQGLSERGNQFHYSRLTQDNRILWGGYDAVYHYGRGMRPEFDQRVDTFERLRAQFFETFPQLRGLGFSHAWGGAIDTCTRFCAFYGTALSGRVTYAAGFTGLGVGATRFAGNVMLDLLDGLHTERTVLRMVRRRPLPFPPEPLAYIGIALTKRALARADQDGGHRNLWLRALDRVGLGFDS
jgi:glycine/D-amino acid oxidase-like deaminating enzyme